MASFIGNASLLMLLVFFTSTMCTCGKSYFPKRKHVRVKNELVGEVTLTVHCKSGDDDLGVKVLAPHAAFEFSFRPKPFGTTRFYCSFEWPGTFHYFDVYIDKRDRERCRLCYWDILPIGPCMYGKCFGWNPSEIA
ncbi:hypothetical protein CerSpe_005690 [Prunus speciosa]